MRFLVQAMIVLAAAWLVIVNVPVVPCSEWDSVYGKVIYANVIFRHGIRAPTHLYPQDPNILHVSRKWPNGLGELTEAGAVQLYNLGKWLRQRYEHLLPPDGAYNRSAIEVLSSDVDRCIMSATFSMAGMFPNRGVSDLGGLVWPMTPVHTIPKQQDNVIRLSRHCKKFRDELGKLKTTSDYLTRLKPYKPLFEFASFKAGINLTLEDPWDFATLYVTLLIEELHGLEIPKWTREIFPAKMAEPVGLIFAIPTFTKTLARLRVGYLLNRILTTMEDKLEGSLDPPTQNLTVYSGHDSTLASLLHAIDLYNFLIPPFASSVLIELRKDQLKGPVVMVFYKNSTVYKDPPILLRHPVCGEACPLSQLRKLWTPLLVDLSSWDSVCGNKR